MLGRMFGAGLDSGVTKTNSHGEYKVAEGVTSEIFRAILDYYKSGIMHCPVTVNIADLKEACQYFLIPFTTETIRCFNLSK
jgi:BTB/POZ domain-containing protein 10